MNEMLLGVALGWAAGISPGPLTALVVTSALQRGFGAGAKVAVAPLITDAPIIALSLLATASLPDTVVTWMSVLGGVYLVFIGVREFRAAKNPESQSDVVGGDVRRGALVNLLSPHPWLFWLTVGGPITVTAWGSSPLSASAFVLAFFLLLVGTKVVLAAVAARVGHRMEPRRRQLLTRISASALGVLGALLIFAAIG